MNLLFKKGITRRQIFCFAIVFSFLLLHKSFSFPEAFGAALILGGARRN